VPARRATWAARQGSSSRVSAAERAEKGWPCPAQNSAWSERRNCSSSSWSWKSRRVSLAVLPQRTLAPSRASSSSWHRRLWSASSLAGPAQPRSPPPVRLVVVLGPARRQAVQPEPAGPPPEARVGPGGESHLAECPGLRPTFIRFTSPGFSASRRALAQLAAMDWQRIAPLHSEATWAAPCQGRLH
jgi:hypothetical protein